MDMFSFKRVRVEKFKTEVSSKKKRLSYQSDTENIDDGNTSEDENFDDESVEDTTDLEEDMAESEEDDSGVVKIEQHSESTDEEDSEQSDEQSDEEDNMHDYLNDAKEVRETLSPEQREVFDYVLRLKKDHEFRQTNSTAVFVGGAAGTGKTELLIKLCDYFKKGVFTATTGVAALNYPSGSTAYSMFGFPLHFNENEPRCNISDYKKEDIFESNIIVFDEVQMSNIRYIEMLDNLLKNLMSSKKHFGGKIIIFAGDYRQVIPVVGGADIPADFSPKSYFGNRFIKRFELSSPYRVKSDRGYFTFLKTLVSNEVENSQAMLEYIGYRNNIMDLISFVYPEYVISKPNECSRRAILALTNSAADEINNKILNIISKTIHITTVKSKDFSNSNVIFVKNQQSDTFFPEKELKMWKGCLCMVIRNMYEPIKLLNGAKVIVEKINSDKIYVRQPGEHKIICIEQQKFVRYVIDPLTLDVTKTERWQFPLKLCYAITIYKSQGQTFDRAGIDLTEDVFRHGQLYLALSRVRHRQDMMVCVNKSQIYNNVAKVKNVVHKHLTF